MSSYETVLDSDAIGEIDIIVEYDYTPADGETDSDAVVVINDVLLRGVTLSPHLLSVLMESKGAEWKAAILKKEAREAEEIAQGVAEWSAGI